MGYASKTLPSVCKNYSVTELGMTGLLVNIAFWKAYLNRCEFDVCVDYGAVYHMYVRQAIFLQLLPLFH